MDFRSTVPLFDRLMTAALPVLLLWCFVFYPIWRIVPSIRESGSFGPDPLISAIVALMFTAGLGISRLSAQLNPHLPQSPTGRPDTGLRWPFVIILLLVLIVFFYHQYPFLGLPLLSTGDEASLAVNQYVQWRSLLATDVGALVAGIGLALALSVICVWAVSRPYRGLMMEAAALALVVVLCFVLAEIIARFHPDWGQYYRRPPLGILSRLPGLVLFGDTELGIRFASSMYAAATAVCAYLVLAAYGQRLAGVLAAILCLTSPVFFLHGILDYRDAAGAFYTTLCILGLSRYLSEQRAGWFYLACFAVAAGYLERRPLMVLGLLCALVLLWQLGVEYRRGMSPRAHLRLGTSGVLVLALTLATALLWMAVYGDRANTRPYIFHPENFFNAKTLLAYPRVTLSLFSWPVMFLLAAGSAFAIYTRQAVVWIALGAILLLCVLFTADDPKWVPTQRFAVNFLPAMAILGAMSILWLRRPWLRAGAVAAVTVLVSVAVHHWMHNEPSSVLGYNRKPAKLIRLPYDSVANDLHQLLGDQSIQLCQPRAWRSIDFYWLRQSGHRANGVPPRRRPARNMSLDFVLEHCRKKQLEWIALPVQFTAGDSLRVLDIRGIRGEDIQRGDVPGFNLHKIYRRGGYGLALLRASSLTRG